jgi:hypothetical protein
VAGHYTDLIHSIGEQTKSALEQLEASNQIIEEVETQINLHSNNVYLETNNSFDNVRDCQKHIFSIAKSLYVSSLSQNQLSQKQESSPQQETPQK